MWTTEELLASMPEPRLRLLSQRWGLQTTSRPLMVELLRTPKVVQRSARRIAELGAGRLLRCLAEAAGEPVEGSAAFASEASLLRDWYVFREEEGRWSLPVDLCLALHRPTDAERLSAATLLRRLPDAQVRSVCRELGLGDRSNVITCIVRVCAHLNLPPERTPELVRAAQVSEEVQAVAGRSIEHLEVVPGSGATLFRLRDVEGNTLELAPRQVAQQLGAFFPPVETSALDGAFQPRLPAFRLPRALPCAALLTFSTAQAAESARRHPAVHPFLASALGDRVLIVRADADLDALQATLDACGFAMTALLTERHASS